MAISAAYQAEIDRLNAYITDLKNQIASASATVDTDDTTALGNALDAAGAPPVPTPPAA